MQLGMKFLLGIALLIMLEGCSSIKTLMTHRQLEKMGIALDDHGNIPGSCSWYCAAPPIKVKASSTRQHETLSFRAENLHDTESNTVWSEGAEGYGIGERIVFTFDMSARDKLTNSQDSDPSALGLEGFSLINGNAQSRKAWKTHTRVKSFRAWYDGVDRGMVHLEDRRAAQKVSLPQLAFVPGKNHRLELEICEVYPGKSTHTAISDIFFHGSGGH